MGLWGTFAYLAALVPRALACDVAVRLETSRILAIVVAVATTGVALPLETAMIGNGWGDALDLATLRSVLFETSVGHAWQVQMVAAVLLAAVPMIPTRVRCGATAIVSGMALIALTSTGHAAMHEGWLGIAHRLNHGLHLLAGGAWFGALVPFIAVLQALDDPHKRREAVVSLRRFSAAGHGAVAVVIVTGMVNTGLILGHWPSDWNSPYQVLLTIKIALVMVMALLALLNRYAVVPRLAKHAGSAKRVIAAVSLINIALGGSVIGLVAAFGRLEPG